MSRSEFFTTAARHYLDELDAASLTRQIDAAVAQLEVIERGELYWAELGPVVGSRPAKPRPVLVIQGSSYNESRLATVLVAVITSNTALATMPGNTFLPAVITGLPRDCVVCVTAIVTVDKTDLGDRIGAVPQSLLSEVDRGLRRVLEL